MKDLRLKFSVYGFIIALLQGIPNIVWVLFPPAVDILKGNSSSNPIIEYGEHILGVSIVILLLFLINVKQQNVVLKNKFTVLSFIFIALYWVCWILYFYEVQYLLIIYMMVILPPIAFFFAGIAKKVYLISGASIVFLIFHLAVAAENFPIKPF